MSTEGATEPQLEPYVPTPTGGQAARCQRVKRDGKQCQKPARTGFSVCSSHGAGYATREAAGERRRLGRPVTHGIYSATPTVSIVDIMAEVEQLADVLESSDRDTLALKSVLVYRLAELESFGPKVEKLEAELETLTVETGDLDSLSIEDTMRLAARLADQRATVKTLNRLVAEVAEASSRNITAHKNRAETTTKLAEQQGVSVAVKLIQVARRVVAALGPQDLIDAYEGTLKRELFGPNRLEVPDISVDPEDL